MRRWIGALPALGIVLAALACGPSAEHPHEEHPDEGHEQALAKARSGMEALAVEWDTAFNAADPAAMVAIYAEANSAIMPNDAPTVTGKEAMLAFFNDFLAQGEASVKNTVEAVVTGGNHVIGKGTYVLTIKGEDGNTQSESGHWVNVSRHQQDGTLKTVRNIWNRDAPLPGQEAPMAIADQGPPPAADAPCHASPMALDHAFESELEAGNVAGLVALHHEDGSRLPPEMPEMAGRTMVSRYLASRVQAFSERSLDLTDIKEASAGSIGLSHGRYSFDYKRPGGGEPAVGAGKYVAVSTKGDDGCWRYRWVIWNRDAPPDIEG